MKKGYTLSQQFALISLDGQSCTHRSAAKSAAVRGIKAAELLEKMLFDEENQPEDGTFLKELEAGITAIRDMTKKEMDVIEKIGRAHV